MRDGDGDEAERSGGMLLLSTDPMLSNRLIMVVQYKRETVVAIKSSYSQTM